MIKLHALFRFPVKGMRGESLRHTVFDARGLAGDRRWMVVDLDGRFVTPRETSMLATLAACGQGPSVRLTDRFGRRLTLDTEQVIAADQWREVQVWDDRVRALDAGEIAAGWLSECLQQRVRLVLFAEQQRRAVDRHYSPIDCEVGFADGFPLLVANQATLDDLQARHGGALTMERLRPNLVVSGTEPYAEYRWRRLRIGELELELVKPCERCVVPAIDPRTGERDSQVVRAMAATWKRDGRVIFGQNAIIRQGAAVSLGQTVEVVDLFRG